ncbi:UNVERIFIED_CONTAM: hypothetical protein GTU68_038676 [Idotea baltica]|nr:hypothetical protein [Idotea baltica]
MVFKYGIDKLSVHKVIDIASGKLTATLSSEAKQKVLECRRKVEAIANGNKAIYGINTGFGPLCDVQITPEETNTLQENLLITHAVGVGKPIDKQLSKIMMICKVHALCRGFSGVRLELIERIVYFIENDLLPVVPEQGSVGASGDLAPLSHLFLPVIGEGEFWVGNKIKSAKTILDKHHLKPLELKAKEGLGLINGTQFILAHTIIGLQKMEYLLDLADVAGAISIEGYQGSFSPFREELHSIRPFRGSIEVAERMFMLLYKSQNVNAHENCGRVQDPYSMRCIPQVHGASRNAFYHLNKLAKYLEIFGDNFVTLTTLLF